MATPSGVELRVLDGPNLYFPRPAVKLTIAVPGWMRASDHRVTGWPRALDGSGRDRTPRARPVPTTAGGSWRGSPRS